MVEVRRVSDRVMTVVIFEEDVLRLICLYDLQSGRSFEKILSFCDELKGEWDMHSAGDLVMCFCDFKDTFTLGDNETDIDIVLIKKSPMVCTKCGGNPW